MGARYYSGGRRRYLWNTEATYRCPYVSSAPENLAHLATETYGVTNLDLIFLRSHQRQNRIRATDENDRPTDRCSCCGAKLDRVGYRVWVEGRAEDVVAELERRGDDAGPTLASARINERLGGDGFVHWPDSTRYFGLKREAIAWCLEQSQQEKAERAEEART